MSNADRSWPRDALGNVLRKGDLIRAALPQPAMNFRVVDVRPASTVLSPGPEGAIAMNGAITLLANVTMEFPEGTQLGDIYKLVQPEPEPGSTIKQ
jgi:hypothetical protein